LAYINKALEPEGDDWSKFSYSYRLWGRTLYNPEAEPEVWRRQLRSEFGAAAEPLEAAVEAAGSDQIKIAGPPGLVVKPGHGSLPKQSEFLLGSVNRGEHLQDPPPPAKS